MTTYIHIHFYIHIPIRFDVCLNADFAKLLHNFALFCLELPLIRLYSLYKFLIVSLSGFYAHLYLPSCMLNYSWHIVKYNFIIYYWFSSLRSWSLKKKSWCSFIAPVCARTITLFLFPELRVLELLVVLEHLQHYSGQIRRDEEEDINF